MTPTTPQEIFDTVAKHLFEQGKPALSSSGGMCVYRGKNGLKCAAGILIPDEMYNDDMEGRTIEETFLPDNLHKSVDLIMELQEIHDVADPNEIRSSVEHWGNWKSTDQMRSALNAVAHTHNLDNSILATLKFKDR